MKTEEIVNQVKAFYLDSLSEKITWKLKRFRKDIMANTEGILKTPWEEICIQLQTEYWAGWGLLDEFVESMCRTELKELPYPIQCALSYDETDEPDTELAWNIDFTTQLLKRNLYQVAINYTNNRIEEYHNLVL